jgi:hypothetical protein
MRIEHAKSRIVADLNRASGIARDLARSTRRGLGTLAVVSGILVAGIVVAALFRRNRRRVHIQWR